MHPLLLLVPIQRVAGSDGVGVDPAAAARSVVDVPLELMPGLSLLGEQRGASFLDYDADGWIDLYLSVSGQLLRNQEGPGFAHVADLDDFLPPDPSGHKYGATCGDYDNDGLPDSAIEPRNGCFQLLKNLDGAANFREVASDPALVLGRPPCMLHDETFCWANLDEDGDLDLFAPAYADEWMPKSGGNRFFENLGPSGPDGAYRLALGTSRADWTTRSASRRRRAPNLPTSTATRTRTGLCTRT